MPADERKKDDEHRRRREAEAPRADAGRSEAREAAPEPGRIGQLIVDARRGAVDRAAADAIARPLGDLAQAFAMQAEVLRNLHESQLRLHETVVDDQRREMMLNATEALNDTFKGVRSTQAELLEKMRTERRGKDRWRWAFLGAMVLMVGFAGWVVLRDGSARSGALDPALAERLQRLEGELPGFASTSQDALANVERLIAGNEDLRARLEQRDERMAGLQVQVGELEGRVAAAGEALARAEEAAGAADERLAEEAARAEDLDRQLGHWMEKYEQAEARAARLNEALLAQIRAAGYVPSPPGAGGAGEADRTAVGETAAATGADAAPATRPSEAAPAPAQPAGGEAVAGVVTALNRLLGDHRGTSTYRLESVGRVGDTALHDVVFTESVSGRGTVREVRADRLRFHVDRAGDVVELSFEGGGMRRSEGASRELGELTPFYQDRWRLMLTILNPDDWFARRDAFIVFE